jgi:predicted NBD/HSP70 family sugar kinase
MGDRENMSTNTTEFLAGHALPSLPSVRIDSYNLDVRDGRKILNHRLRRAAFFEGLAKIAAEEGNVFDGRAAEELSRKEIEHLLRHGDAGAIRVIEQGIEAFAAEIADVVAQFLKTKEWTGVERISIGGGFRKGRVGKRSIAKASAILSANGAKVELVPIRHRPDEAGLIGGAHLLPTWMLKGHDAMICADIGGTNLRVGVVELRLRDAPDLSHATVVESDLWKHAEEDPKRTETVSMLVRMVRKLIRHSERQGLDLVPVIAIACPGVIDEDGSILRGAVNLPGGNWESERFNLSAAVTKEIKSVGDERTIVLMHNDAVVQGLSQTSWMTDVRRWGIMTIGTGLGNACFTNRES